MFWTVPSASLVAYLASLTILFALAFEPFSQQLLHYDEHLIAYPDQPSSVSFSTVYDFDSQGVDGASSVIGNIVSYTQVFCVYIDLYAF